MHCMGEGSTQLVGSRLSAKCGDRGRTSSSLVESMLTLYRRSTIVPSGRGSSSISVCSGIDSSTICARIPLVTSEASVCLRARLDASFRLEQPSLEQPCNGIRATIRVQAREQERRGG